MIKTGEAGDGRVVRNLSGRLFGDESGMAMGLAVITMVIIGVMGAGLLAFVVSDLNAVVEVNQGQRAFEMADAGVGAAKRQLASDPASGSYNDAAPTGDDVQWAKSKGGVTLNNLDASSATIDRVNVTVQNVGSTSFKVISTGEYGPAKRTIEAIFGRSGGAGSGGTNYIRTPGRINLSGGLNLTGTTVYAAQGASTSGNITLNSSDLFFGDSWSMSGDVSTTGTSPFGNWQNSFNPTPRPSTAPGVASTNLLIGGDLTTRKGTQFFDSATTPQFSSTGAAGRITFPFDTTVEPDLVALRAKANAQEAANPSQPHFITATSDYTLSSWPAGSTQDTVVFVDFTGSGGNNFVWRVPGSCTDTDAKGTLVLNGANWSDSGASLYKRLYGGVVVKRRAGDGTQNGVISRSGGTCIGGSIFADGDISVSGGISSVTEPTPNLPSIIPGSGEPKPLSWRECYTANCN